MVGTAEYHLTRNSRSQPKKFLTSQPGAQTTPAPAASGANTVSISPWQWNSGNTFKHRSVSVSAMEATELYADEQILAWVSGTIFGRAVVPEVKIKSAMLPGPTGSWDGLPGRSARSENK